MHFPGSSSHCHDDIREGLVRTVRMVLHNTYPTLSEDGFNVLQSSPPVIYITTSTYQDAAEYICVQLGLPRSTVRFIHSFIHHPFILSFLHSLILFYLLIHPKTRFQHYIYKPCHLFTLYSLSYYFFILLFNL